MTETIIKAHTVEVHTVEVHAVAVDRSGAHLPICGRSGLTSTGKSAPAREVTDSVCRNYLIDEVFEGSVQFMESDEHWAKKFTYSN